MFATAIVGDFPHPIGAVIPTAGLGQPAAAKAREQHRSYLAALEDGGLEVILLVPDERYPDSVFVEDTAVVNESCAIVTKQGAPERRGEIREVERVLVDLYGEVERITGPGTVDGGDVLQVREHFYVGLSMRTNREGAEQLSAILHSYEFGVSFVGLRRLLHLKTGVAYLGGDDI